MMISELTANEIVAVLGFAWDVYCDGVTSCYPRFDSADELRASFLAAVNHADDVLLAAYVNGAVSGVLNLFVDRENRYMQSNGIFISRGGLITARELIDGAKTRFPGYKLLLGYPKTATDALNIMQFLGADIIESSAALLLDCDNFVPQPRDETVRAVTSDNFDAFAAYHDAKNVGAYWTSERIRARLDDWRVFVAEHRSFVLASIAVAVWDAEQAEIYALASDVAYAAPALLSVAAEDVFASGAQSVLFMADDSASEIIAAAERIGFTETGGYVCLEM